VSGAATDGAITDTEARDGGEDAGAGVGATTAGRGGVAKAEEAIAVGVEAFDGERNWPMECRIGKPCKNVDCEGGTGVISEASIGGGVAITGAAAVAGAKAESGAATDGAITDPEAGDGGEDAGAAVGATAAGRGGLTTEEAMAAAEGALALVGGTGTGTVGAGTIESGRGTEGATGNASAEEEGAWEEAAASVRACIVA
jgi:hypothetical protein